MEDRTAELEQLVAGMRAGEAEIGRRMFEQKRARRQHLAWLRFQITREARNLEEIAAALYTRGGGGALFHGFVGLGGGDFERLLAAASKLILRDELHEGRDQLYPLIRSGDDVETD